MSTPNKTVLWQAILNLEAALGRLGGGGPDTGDATQYAFVYQPGGVTAKNVYTTWPALYAAINVAAPVSSNGSRAPSAIQIDDSFVSPAVIPAGAYNLDSVAFLSVANFNVSEGGSLLHFANGAVITCGNLTFAQGLTAVYLGTGTLIPVSGASQEVNLFVEGGSQIEASGGGGSFVNVTNGYCFVRVQNGVLGDGANLWGTATAPGTLDVHCYGGGSYVESGALTGGAATFLHWDLAVPGTQGPGVVITQVDGYVPATPANWSPPPTSLNTALDQLAARTTPSSAGFAFVNVTLPPFNVDNTGATDAGPALAVALTGTGPATGQTSWLPKSVPQYTVHTPLLAVQPNSQLRGSAAASIVSTIPFVDGFTDVLFSSSDGQVLRTTLAVTIVEGSSVAQVASTAGLPVGGYILIYRNGDAALSFKQVGIGVIGSTDITAGALYGGGGTLAGETLILDTGSGPTVLNLNGATNAASETNLIAAIKVQWPTLSVVQAGPGIFGGINLVLTGPSLVVGAGTANAHLGIVAGALNAVQTDVPIMLAYQAGDQVYSIPNRVHGLHFDFLGTNISGTGGRVTGFAALWDSILENAVVDSSWTVFCLDYDLGSRNAIFRKSVCNFIAGSAGAGQIIESGQDGTIESCSAVGPFTTGQTIAGYAHKVRGSSGHGNSTGLSLQALGVTDIFAARCCEVSDCDYDGCASGVIVQDNSYGNSLKGIHANSNGGSGIFVTRGTFTAATTGPSKNTFAASETRGNAVTGVGVSDGVTGPVDGNRFPGHISTGNGRYGYWILGTASNTSLVGALASDNLSDGVNVAAGATGTDVSNLTSETNGGIGLNAGGDVLANGFSSTNDAGGGIDVTGAAKFDGEEVRLSATFNGFWIGFGHDSTGTSHVSGRIDCAGTGVKIGVSVTAGVLYVSYLRMTGGSFGLSLGGGTTHIGPGVELDAASVAPVSFGGGAVTMDQTGGVAQFNATGVATFAQHYAEAIEYQAGSGADGTITWMAIPGMVWAVNNVSAHNLTLKTTTAATVVVTAGKKTMVYVDSAGDMIEVTSLL